MNSCVIIAAVAAFNVIRSQQSHIVVTGFVYPRTEKSLVCCTSRIPTSSITTKHYNPKHNYDLPHSTSVTYFRRNRNNLKFPLASRTKNDDGPRPPKSSTSAKIRSWARKVTGISISSIISRRKSKETVEKSKEMNPITSKTIAENARITEEKRKEEERIAAEKARIAEEKRKDEE